MKMRRGSGCGCGLTGWNGFKMAAMMGFALLVHSMAYGQAPGAKPGDAASEDDEGKAAVVSLKATPEERASEAWMVLTDAMGDVKHPQTRVQALAALGLMRSPKSEKMILDAMADPDVDIRTAAVLAAGETKDHNMTTALRNQLDDKEPQVAFAAAMTLWKMGDKSGEDILMAVVGGERSAGPTMYNGTKHRILKELHDPAAMARLGAMQGASMLLGPFGYGLTAYEYIRRNGGDLARVSAIEQITQEKTAPVHKALVDALKDKDPAVRAAAAKALVDSRDEETSMAIYALLADDKHPVRMTAAAAYLRTTGVPGPSIPQVSSTPVASTKTTLTPHSTKPHPIPR